MGSLLLCAGAKDMRFATPNARIMVHQPSGGFQGQASDIERHAQDIIKLKRRLNEIYVKHTGRDLETIEKTLDRDHFMTSDEALDFGLIDKVISSRETMEAHREMISPSIGPKSVGFRVIPMLDQSAGSSLCVRMDARRSSGRIVDMTHF